MQLHCATRVAACERVSCGASGLGAPWCVGVTAGRGPKTFAWIGAATDGVHATTAGSTSFGTVRIGGVRHRRDCRERRNLRPGSAKGRILLKRRRSLALLVCATALARLCAED